ncbi:MAG: hypothetical protein ACK4P3_09645 [Fimbriimonadaceae bacterium]
MKFFGLACLLGVLVFLAGCTAPTDAGPILESQGKPIPATAEEAKILGESGKLPASGESTTTEREAVDPEQLPREQDQSEPAEQN